MAKFFKITFKLLLIMVVVVVAAAGSYVGYMTLSFYRIDDNLSIKTQNNQIQEVKTNKDYTLSTYNIGFGAYSPEFSFFMDTGVMQNGKETKGLNGKALSKESVIKNTNGAIDLTKKFGADFLFFQEVDTKSTRSYRVNQLEMIRNSYNNYASAYAVNFHSSYLMYPLNDMHGSVNAGIVTLSKYKIDENIRRSFPVDMSFPTKFFDLDRCFMVSRYNLDNGKQLVLINIHMSAYDEGGVYRAKQLALLNQVLKVENDKGNYVIAGGDFNHDIANSKEIFPTKQKLPDWLCELTNKDLAQGYSFATDTSNSTCRGADIPYTKGVNYCVVIDGYIVSDNIEVKEVKNVGDFEYSDHNPVRMTFAFKSE